MSKTTSPTCKITVLCESKAMGGECGLISQQDNEIVGRDTRLLAGVVVPSRGKLKRQSSFILLNRL